jgi:hypothetical protein
MHLAKAQTLLSVLLMLATAEKIGFTTSDEAAG